MENAAPNAPPLHLHMEHEQTLNAQRLQVPNYQQQIAFKDIGQMQAIQSTQERPVTSQPIIVLNTTAAPQQLGQKPQRLNCPYCNTKMLTRLDYRVSRRTHLFAFALCITGLLCCAPLPYCLKTCKTLDHYCSNCDQFVGKSVS